MIKYLCASVNGVILNIFERQIEFHVLARSLLKSLSEDKCNSLLPFVFHHAFNNVLTKLHCNYKSRLDLKKNLIKLISKYKNITENENKI